MFQVMSQVLRSGCCKYLCLGIFSICGQGDPYSVSYDTATNVVFYRVMVSSPLTVVICWPVFLQQNQYLHYILQVIVIHCPA